LGIAIFLIYLLGTVNWMEMVLGNKLYGYLLWIILGILFIRGIIKKKNLVVPISVGLGFLLSYVGILAYMFGGPVVKDYANRISFDATKWQNEELVHSRNPVRIRMVDDLLKKHSLVGMTKENLIVLLGAPPKTGYFSNYDFVYWLGLGRGFGSLDEWLVIKFRNDKVIEARIVRDKM
jgi:hypothetical protein